ncbi:Crp/Fnr family transcriptional regulator [Ferruginibacter sp. SUN106]|uniref:Crp/Fnr family transcriptional regulator n=1 Tax=Ferruginibacter sp. SUN106 TaxID=2978348 RepID=UPI003D36A69E
MTEALQHHIQKILAGHTMPVDEMTTFFTTKTVKKGEILLNENEPCHDIFFVNKGCLYMFYNHNNKKHVVHFALENWWITDYKTFSEGRPAGFAITAMEDSVITFMSREKYDNLLLQFPLMALYFNKIHERAYGAALFKQKTFATVSKEDFYKHFSNTYPALMPRIPDAVFAAYMDVSPETLQKIKAAYVS